MSSRRATPTARSGAYDRPSRWRATALVIDVGDTAVTLAVGADEASGLAGVLGRGVPVLALVGGR